MRPATLIAALIAGVLFGFGLACSTMIKPEVVLSFLRFQDFGLLFVMGGGAFVTLLAYQLVPRILDKPLFGDAFGRHPSNMNRDTLVGAAIFGVGWGLCGVCPGPAIAGLGAGNWPLFIAIAGMFAGALLQGVIWSRRS